MYKPKDSDYIVHIYDNGNHTVEGCDIFERKMVGQHQ